MLSITNPYSANVLHSYENLENYLVGEQADLCVQGKLLEAQQSYNLNWLGRWKVVPLIVTTTWQQTIAIPLYVLSCAVYMVGLKTLSDRLWLHALLHSSNYELESFWKYEQKLLAPAINAPSLDSFDIYSQKPLEENDIVDERIRRIINPYKFPLNFQNTAGICRGASLWFIRQYFKTQDLFTNSDDHIRAVGSLFSSGCSREANLIQTLCMMDLRLLQLREAGEMSIPTEPTHQERIQKLTNVFQDLLPGVYKCNTPRHVFTYIAKADGTGYLFDPNKGTIAIQTPENFQILAALILDYYNEMDLAMQANLVSVFQILPDAGMI